MVLSMERDSIVSVANNEAILVTIQCIYSANWLESFAENYSYTE